MQPSSLQINENEYRVERIHHHHFFSHLWPYAKIRKRCKMFFDVFLKRSSEISMFLLSMIWETSFVRRKVFFLLTNLQCLSKSWEKWFKVSFMIFFLESIEASSFRWLGIIFQVEKLYNKWWTKTCQSVYLSLLNWNCSLTLSSLSHSTHLSHSFLWQIPFLRIVFWWH